MKRLNLTYPIIQAPMAGGGDTPDLVAAVCNAGALGFVGAAYLTPAQIIETGQAIRARTSRPFGINLFAPSPPPEAPANPAAALARVAPFFAELGLPAPSAPESKADAFADQFLAALECGASIFSFVFGILPASALEMARRRGMLLMGTATTVNEALALERAGVDMVIAQGAEAGGHRGTFLNGSDSTGFDSTGNDLSFDSKASFDSSLDSKASFESSFNSSLASGMIGTIALVPQIVDAVKLPVIAAGGIMDGRGITAALALGADAVQMGTAFLTCTEAGVPEAYKEAILNAHEDQTRITRAFSGRPARGIVNRFMLEIDSDQDPAAILPFPLQNTLTRPLRAAAGRAGRAEMLSLWAGQGVRMARRQSAAELIARLGREIRSRS